MEFGSPPQNVEHIQIPFESPNMFNPIERSFKLEKSSRTFFDPRIEYFIGSVDFFHFIKESFIVYQFSFFEYSVDA